MEVSELDPARIMLDIDKDAGVVTPFVVEPLDENKKAWVTIASGMRASPGLKGSRERLFNPPLIRRNYKRELRQLDAKVRTEVVAIKRTD